MNNQNLGEIDQSMHNLRPSTNQHPNNPSPQLPNTGDSVQPQKTPVWPESITQEERNPLRRKTTIFEQQLDREARRIIIYRLFLILHAQNCQQRKEQANGDCKSCNYPQCQKMKNVLHHVTVCKAGETCQVPDCASFQQIIAHWSSCSRTYCRVCSPLRNIYPQKKPGWRESITQEERNQMCEKIVSAFLLPEISATIFQAQHNLGKDELNLYAQKIEDGLFKRAVSEADYFDLLNEKIFKIITEPEAWSWLVRL